MLLQKHLVHICEEKDISRCTSSFDKLPKIIQDLLLYTTWDLNGQIQGLHNDFGRASYFNSDEIPQIYWMSTEQTTALILDIIEVFNRSDSEMLS